MGESLAQTFSEEKDFSGVAVKCLMFEVFACDKSFGATGGTRRKEELKIRK
jgi:hypothetical protein